MRRQTVVSGILKKGLFLCLIMARLYACHPSSSSVTDSGRPDYKTKVQAYYQASKKFFNSGNDSLNYYAGKIISIGTAHHDTSVIVKGELLRANYELRISNYPATVKTALKALSLARQKHFARRIPKIYFIIGNAYKENESYKGALSAAQKALEASRAINDTSLIIGALLNKAMFTHSYSMLKDNDSIAKVSLQLYRKGLRLARSNPKFEIKQIPFLDDISQYYSLTGDYQKGIRYGREGARLAKKYNQTRSLTYSLNWLGKMYYYQGHHQKGIAYLDSALHYAKGLKWDFRIAEILYSKYRLYHSSGNAKHALANYVRSQAIMDSLQVLENVKQVSRLQTQYQTGRKDQKIAMLSRLNKQKAQRTRNILIGAGVLVLLTIFLGYQYRVIKHRNRQISENYDKISRQSEKLKLLMKELNHRVKNNLQIVSSLLSLQSHHLSDERALRAVETGQQRIHAMSLIHRSLYQQENPGMVDMPEYVEGLINRIVQSFGRHNGNIDLQIDVDVEELDVDIALPVGLIINEWVTNSFKYAFDDVARPKLSVSLTGRGEIMLEMKDNGPGMDRADWENSEGSFGIKLIKVLNKQLEGRCEMDNSNGTRLYMVIPLEHLMTVA